MPPVSKQSTYLKLPVRRPSEDEYENQDEIERVGFRLNVSGNQHLLTPLDDTSPIASYINAAALYAEKHADNEVSLVYKAVAVPIHRNTGHQSFMQAYRDAREDHISMGRRQ